MTREEALLKLLHVEPERRDVIMAVTGWPMEETSAVLDALVADGRVSFEKGPVRIHGQRHYFPAQRMPRPWRT